MWLQTTRGVGPRGEFLHSDIHFKDVAQIGRTHDSTGGLCYQAAQVGKLLLSMKHVNKRNLNSNDKMTSPVAVTAQAGTAMYVIIGN